MLISDVFDQVNWKWVGNATHEVQSDHIFLGEAPELYNRSEPIEVPSGDSSSNFHTYTINWQKDMLQWKIDGNVVRELHKKDTLSKDGTR